MKARFNSSLMMTLAVSTSILGGVAMSALPAQAFELSLGNTVQVGTGITSGSVTVSRTSSNLYDFDFETDAPQFVLRASSNPPFVPGDEIFFKSLTNIVVGTPTGAIEKFITGFNLADGSLAVFDATSILLTEGANLNLALAGVFREVDEDGNYLTDSILGKGNLSLQFSMNPSSLALNTPTETSFSGTIEVVPTPAAVLPGLIGMGTAVFRKKKQEDEGEVTLETAGVRS